MTGRALLCPLLLGGVLAGWLRPAAAQTVPERFVLVSRPDSLATSGDTSMLRQAYLRLVAAHGRKVRDPVAQMRLGSAALRLAELGADPGADRARRHFGLAAELAPDRAAAWHLLGLAEVRRAAWEQSKPLALGSRVGIGTLERAAERQLRALAAEPGYVPAALLLTDITLGLRDTARYGEARAAVRAAVSARSRPPADLLLAWGRMERASGDAAAADSAFRRFLAAGGERGLGLLERARAGLAAGRPGADSLYFAGAAFGDPDPVAGYRADLAPIADDAELGRFDRLHGAARAAWLRRFWVGRDRYEMRPAGDRLREHYRRLLHARRSFALTVSRRFYGPADAYRSGNPEIDDRGVIYVRHGEPSERHQPFVFGLMPNETWRYTRGEGDLLFHFSSGYDRTAGGDLYDYRLVESVLDLRGAGEAPIDQLLLSRDKLSPLYGRMLNWGTYGRARARASERGLGRASIEVGTTTDSYALRFARPLVAVADLVAVGNRPGGSLAHLVFALGEPGASADTTPSGVRYRVRVRAVALAATDRPPESVDTTVELRADRPLRPGQYLAGRVELMLPAGRWTWRAAFSQEDSAGIVLTGDSVKVAGDSSPALSDLALGARETGARWSPTPSDTVLLTPFGLFRQGGEVELYYEAAGAVAGSTYRHEIAVYRMKGSPGRPDRRPVVSLGFEEPAREALIRSHRTLQLRTLKPGRYLIEVRLTGPRGRTSLRRREFQVVRFRGD